MNATEDAEIGTCDHPNEHFDRTICALCNGMHYYCDDCGTVTDDCEDGNA